MVFSSTHVLQPQDVLEYTSLFKRFNNTISTHLILIPSQKNATNTTNHVNAWLLPDHSSSY